MKKIMFIFIFAILCLSCSKSKKENIKTGKYSRLSITVGSHHYDDSLVNTGDSALGTPCLYGGIIYLNDNSGNVISRCSFYIGTSHIGIHPFYAQKNDISTTTGIYYTGLSQPYSSAIIPNILIHDAVGTFGEWYAIDDSGKVIIDICSNGELKGRFSFNAKNQNTLETSLVTGDFDFYR